MGIDSAMMHSAAVFKKPMLVFWSQTRIDNLGYNYPGVFNKWKDNAMYGRPAVSMPDNANVLSYRAPNEFGAWDYKRDEIETAVGEFVNFILNAQRQAQR